MVTSKRWKDIFEAAENKDTAAVRYFVEAEGVLVNSTDPDERRTAAHIAAKHKDLPTLEYLVKVDSSVLTLGDVYFDTVTNVLIAQNALDIIKRLVDGRLIDIAQPNDQRFGNNAIHEAAEKGRLDILKYFVEEKGADVDTLNEFLEPPAFLAAGRNHFGVVKYLHARGANFTTLDQNNENILYISARKGDTTLPKFLLDEKHVRLNVNWRNSIHMTIVHTAAKLNQLNFLRYIIGMKRADINARDAQNRSALHFAARANNFEVVQYLFKQGANPQFKDAFGRTALESATQPNVIKYLEKVTIRRPRREVSTLDLLRQKSTYRELGSVSEWANAFRFDHFFVLADFYLKCGRGNRRRCGNDVHRSMSRKNSMVAESKIDPFALDAVYNTKFTFT